MQPEHIESTQPTTNQNYRVIFWLGIFCIILIAIGSYMYATQAPKSLKKEAKPADILASFGVMVPNELNMLCNTDNMPSIAPERLLWHVVCETRSNQPYVGIYWKRPDLQKMSFQNRVINNFLKRATKGTTDPLTAKFSCKENSVLPDETDMRSVMVDCAVDINGASTTTVYTTFIYIYPASSPVLKAMPVIIVLSEHKDETERRAQELYKNLKPVTKSNTTSLLNLFIETAYAQAGGGDGSGGDGSGTGDGAATGSGDTGSTGTGIGSGPGDPAGTDSGVNGASVSPGGGGGDTTSGGGSGFDICAIVFCDTTPAPDQPVIPGPGPAPENPAPGGTGPAPTPDPTPTPGGTTNTGGDTTVIDWQAIYDALIASIDWAGIWAVGPVTPAPTPATPAPTYVDTSEDSYTPPSAPATNPTITDVALNFPNITFICHDATNYTVMHDSTGALIKQGLAISGTTITAQISQEGDYTLKCSTPNAFASAIVTYTEPAITLNGMSISANPRTINNNRSTALSWSVLNPKNTCKLRAETVCSGGRASCSQAQLTEESSLNSTFSSGTTDANDPYGASRNIQTAVRTVAPENNPTHTKALGKKTLLMSNTTDFILDCGGSLIKKVRVIVSDENEG